MISLFSLTATAGEIGVGKSPKSATVAGEIGVGKSGNVAGEIGVGKSVSFWDYLAAALAGALRSL